MTRYDAIIGLALIGDKEYPVIRCEVIVDDLDTADFILEFMGQRIFEFQESKGLPMYPKYAMN